MSDIFDERGNFIGHHLIESKRIDFTSVRRRSLRGSQSPHGEIVKRVLKSIDESPHHKLVKRKCPTVFEDAEGKTQIPGCSLNANPRKPTELKDEPIQQYTKFDKSKRKPPETPPNSPVNKPPVNKPPASKPPANQPPDKQPISKTSRGESITMQQGIVGSRKPLSFHPQLATQVNDEDNQAQTVSVARFPDQNIVSEYPEITPEEYNAAAMSRTAYIRQDEGNAAAEAYARENVGDGWVYDEELSNEMAAVFSKDGKAAIAYRGTVDPPGINKDWAANARNFLGVDRHAALSKQENIINEQLKKTLLKHPGGIDMTTGHSRGGAEAIKTALKTAVRRVINFNSASYLPDNIRGVNSEVTTLRSVGTYMGDVVSSNTDVISGNRIKYVPSKFGENPVDGLHALANFEKNPYEKPSDGIEMSDANMLKPPSENLIAPDDDIVIKPSDNLSAPDRANEFGSLEDSLQIPEVEETAPTVKGNLVAGGVNTITGLGAGIGISKALEAAGSHNVVANTLISGAGGGAVGKAGELAAKEMAKAAGMTVTKQIGESVAKGILKGAKAGGAAAIVALPVEYGVQKGLEAAGLDKFTAMPISGGVAGVAGAGALAGAGSILAEEGAVNFWNPVGWASIAMAGVIGAGVSEVFALQGKSEEEQKEIQELQHQFLRNQKDIENYDEKGGLNDNDLQRIRDSHPEFFDNAKEQFARAQRDYEWQRNHLQEIETKYQNNLHVGDPREHPWSVGKRFGVIRPEGGTITDIYGSKLVNLTRDDREYIQKNDPTFFSRYGEYQDLMIEEYKYATGMQLSDFDTNMVKQKDPEFFNRIYPTMHPDDVQELNNPLNKNYVAPGTTHKMTESEQLEASYRTGGQFDSSVQSASS